MKRTDRRQFLKTVGAGAAAAALRPKAFARAGAERVSLQFWDMRVGPVDTYANAAKKIVGEYNALNSKVSVSYELEEWHDWPQVFSIAVGSGIGPDISTGGSYQAVPYFDQGDVIALDDLAAELQRSDEGQDFLPGSLAVMTYKGHAIGLPWGTDPRAIFYRKDLLAKAGIEPPRSWDELRAAAKAVTTGGIYGFVVAGGEIIGTHSLLLLMMNNRGGLFTADGRLDLTSSRNFEAATFFSSLAKDGSIHPDCTKFTWDRARNEFIAGRAAMIVGAAGLAAFVGDQQDKMGVLRPPMGPHGDTGTVAWVPNLMLYKESKNPEAAKQFLKWWLGNNKALWIDGHCENLPIRRSILNDPYFQSNPILKTIAEEWVPIAKGLGWRKQDVSPFLSTLDGYGPLPELSNDLLAGKNVEASMQLAEERLKALMSSDASPR